MDESTNAIEDERGEREKKASQLLLFFAARNSILPLASGKSTPHTVSFV